MTRLEKARAGLTPERWEALESWYDALPASMKPLADTYLPGDTLVYNGVIYYVLGFSETPSGPHLIASPVDPWDDYPGAVGEITYFDIKSIIMEIPSDG